MLICFIFYKFVNYYNHVIYTMSEIFYLRVFIAFLRSGVNYAYRSYKKPLRTANSKKLEGHLTPIYIFLGPIE